MAGRGPCAVLVSFVTNRAHDYVSSSHTSGHQRLYWKKHFQDGKPMADHQFAQM